MPVGWAEESAGVRKVCRARRIGRRGQRMASDPSNMLMLAKRGDFIKELPFHLVDVDDRTAILGKVYVVEVPGRRWD